MIAPSTCCAFLPSGLPVAHIARPLSPALHALSPGVACRRPARAMRTRVPSMRADDPRASRSLAQIASDASDVYGRDKPPWCQPWTILATGTFAISSSWAVLRGPALLLAAFITTAVLLWWFAFLVAYPQAALRDRE